MFYVGVNSSASLREEYELVESENVVLRTLFGPKRQKATGDWRKLHK